MNLEHDQFIGLHCDIVSAERGIFSGQVRFLSITGSEGELGIAQGHSPLITAIPPGEMKLIDRENKERFFFVEGGYLEVQPHCITVLADTVMRASEIDLEKAQKAKAHAESVLAGSHSSKEINYSQAAHQLLEAMAKIHVIEAARRAKMNGNNKK